MNICKKFHGDLSHRCWDIPDWTNTVERLSQPTSPSTKAVNLINPLLTSSNIDRVTVKLTVDLSSTDAGSLGVKVDTNMSESKYNPGIDRTAKVAHIRQHICEYINISDRQPTSDNIGWKIFALNQKLCHGC